MYTPGDIIDIPDKQNKKILHGLVLDVNKDKKELLVNVIASNEVITLKYD